jgi:hypothetical protein
VCILNNFRKEIRFGTEMSNRTELSKTTIRRKTELDRQEERVRNDKERKRGMGGGGIAKEWNRYQGEKKRATGLILEKHQRSNILSNCLFEGKVLSTMKKKTT